MDKLMLSYLSRYTGDSVSPGSTGEIVKAEIQVASTYSPWQCDIPNVAALLLTISGGWLDDSKGPLCGPAAQLESVDGKSPLVPRLGTVTLLSFTRIQTPETPLAEMSTKRAVYRRYTRLRNTRAIRTKRPLGRSAQEQLLKMAVLLPSAALMARPSSSQPCGAISEWLGELLGL